MRESARTRATANPVYPRQANHRDKPSQLTPAPLPMSRSPRPRPQAPARAWQTLSHQILLAKSGPARCDALQCAFFQAAHIGPNLGRLNDQLTAPDEEKNPQMIQLFLSEEIRLTEVLDRMLEDDRPLLAGDYSIADVMHYPWLKAVLDLQFPAMMEKPRLPQWMERISKRAAVKEGMEAFGEEP